MEVMLNNVESISLSNNDFSIELYSKLSELDGSIFFSPISIHIVMFMASIGAATQTYDEILKTIHLTKKNSTKLLENYEQLLDDLTENNVLKFAIGIFIDDSFKIKHKYVENTSHYLKSTTAKLNFKEKAEDQRILINKWVESKTNGRINNLLPFGSISKDSSLILANAVHFNSSWQYKFSNIQNEFFYISPSQKKYVSMMNLNRHLNYFHDKILKYSVVELPYKDYNFKMVIMLPDANDGLRNLELNLSKINIKDLTKKLKTFDVNVKLPQFQLELSYDLKNTLIEMGCSTMFTKNANFSNILVSLEKTLFVNKIVHKSYIEVNKDGTEAASSTGVYIQPLAGHRAVNFHADHPFMFVIASQKNDIIFMGRFNP